MSLWLPKNANPKDFRIYHVASWTNPHTSRPCCIAFTQVEISLPVLRCGIKIYVREDLYGYRHLVICWKSLKSPQWLTLYIHLCGYYTQFLDITGMHTFYLYAHSRTLSTVEYLAIEELEHLEEERLKICVLVPWLVILFPRLSLSGDDIWFSLTSTSLLVDSQWCPVVSAAVKMTKQPDTSQNYPHPNCP